MENFKKTDNLIKNDFHDISRTTKATETYFTSFFCYKSQLSNGICYSTVRCIVSGQAKNRGQVFFDPVSSTKKKISSYANS